MNGDGIIKEGKKDLRPKNLSQVLKPLNAPEGKKKEVSYNNRMKRVRIARPVKIGGSGGFRTSGNVLGRRGGF